MRSDDCPQTAYPLCLERLSSIETKLDTFLKQFEDTEKRLRDLEIARQQASGGAKVIQVIAIAIGGVAGALCSLIISHFKIHP